LFIRARTLLTDSFKKAALAWHEPTGPLWVFMQHGAARGLLAAKFLILARILGPDGVGLISAALLAVAIGEALTDLGLEQAIVQRLEPPNTQQLSAVWTFLLVRGLLIGTSIFFSARPVALLFGVPDAVPLIQLAATIPIVRNATNVGLAIAYRHRNFRIIALLQSGTSLLDAALSVILLLSSGYLLSVIYGTLLAELARMVVSHMIFRHRPSLDFNARKISDLTTYGRWIWGSSLLTFFLNQFDRVLAGRYLGSSGLGVYHVSTRLAQVGISDLAVGLGKYIFPTLSESYRGSTERASNQFTHLFVAVLSIILPTVTYVVLLAPLLIRYVLGPEWLGAIPTFQLLVANMGFGALITLLVAYLRAVGTPRAVTESALLQAVVMVPIAWTGVMNYGLMGLAAAVTIGGVIAFLFLTSRAAKAGADVWAPAILACALLIPIALAFLYPPIVAQAIGVYPLVISLIYVVFMLLIALTTKRSFLPTNRRR
jgi:O-antigen/teichoic acid export membrane protein